MGHAIFGLTSSRHDLIGMIKLDHGTSSLACQDGSWDLIFGMTSSLDIDPHLGCYVCYIQKKNKLHVLGNGHSYSFCCLQKESRAKDTKIN